MEDKERKTLYRFSLLNYFSDDSFSLKVEHWHYFCIGHNQVEVMYTVYRENFTPVLLARLHFSAEELLLYPRRRRPRWRPQNVRANVEVLEF